MTRANPEAPTAAQAPTAGYGDVTVEEHPAGEQIDPTDADRALPPWGRRGSRTPSPADDVDEPAPEITLRELAHRLNAFFYNKHTGLVLILAMAFFTLMGTLLQQSPDGLTDDPAAYAEWLDGVRPRYGGWTGVLSTLGFFQVFSSLWFKITTVLLAVSIVACTLHRAPQLWERALRPHLHVSDGFFRHAGIGGRTTLAESPAAARERAESVLRAHKYRVLEDPKDPAGSFYADRFRFAPFGTVVAHASFVLILLGVFISSAFGFHLDEFPVAVGTRANVGQGTDLTVEARSFTDTYYPDGRPQDYVSDLVLYRGGRQVARQQVRVNTPLRHDGVSFYQSYFGIAASVAIKDSTGKVVFDGSVPLQYKTDDERHVFGTVTLPAQQLKVFILGAASGRTDADVAPGQMQVDVFKAGSQERADSATVDQATSAKVGGLDVTFQRERQFTGLMVSRDPGTLWVWVGSALMMAGLVTTLFVKHRRIWVRVRPAGGTDETQLWLASADRNDTIFERRVRGYLAELSTPATHPTPEKVGRS